MLAKYGTEYFIPIHKHPYRIPLKCNPNINVTGKIIVCNHKVSLINQFNYYTFIITYNLTFN